MNIPDALVTVQMIVDMEVEVLMTKTASDYPMALTINDVAEIMGIGRSKAYEILQNPKFPVIREGRRLIIPRDAFFRWLDPGYTRDDSSNQPLSETYRIAREDSITEICTQALVEAVNKGTITVKELVAWAINSRFRQ